MMMNKTRLIDEQQMVEALKAANKNNFSFLRWDTE